MLGEHPLRNQGWAKGPGTPSEGQRREPPRKRVYGAITRSQLLLKKVVLLVEERCTFTLKNV
jgi:hypothetical protein